MVFGIFILFRPWVIDNNVKNMCVENRSLIFANNSKFKQNKKDPDPFVDM